MPADRERRTKRVTYYVVVALVGMAVTNLIVGWLD